MTNNLLINRILNQMALFKKIKDIFKKEKKKLKKYINKKDFLVFIEKY